MAGEIVSGKIQRINDSFYQVTSQSGHRDYTVNPQKDTCTCPDALYRGNHNCKHLRAVRDLIAETETPLAAAARKAKTLTETELYHHAAQRNGTAAGCACLLELANRKRAEDEEAELRRIFS